MQTRLVINSKTLDQPLIAVVDLEFDATKEKILSEKEINFQTEKGEVLVKNEDLRSVILQTLDDYGEVIRQEVISFSIVANGGTDKEETTRLETPIVVTMGAKEENIELKKNEVGEEIDSEVVGIPSGDIPYDVYVDMVKSGLNLRESEPQPETASTEQISKEDSMADETTQPIPEKFQSFREKFLELEKQADYWENQVIEKETQRIEKYKDFANVLDKEGQYLEEFKKEKLG